MFRFEYPSCSFVSRNQHGIYIHFVMVHIRYNSSGGYSRQTETSLAIPQNIQGPGRRLLVDRITENLYDDIC